jgi:hypothetical protein
MMATVMDLGGERFPRGVVRLLGGSPGTVGRAESAG